MAVRALNSNIISDADAKPPKMTLVTFKGARVRSSVVTVELLNNDSIGTTIRLDRLKSNDRIEYIGVMNDAITGAAIDVGLYETTQAGGAVVDQDAYASAVSIASASSVPTNIAFEARDVAAVANRLWQDAGASADTQKQYDLVATLTAASTAAGTLSFIIHYAVD